MGVLGILDRIPIHEKLSCKRNRILSRRAVEADRDIVVRFVALVLQTNKTPRDGHEGSGHGICHEWLDVIWKVPGLEALRSLLHRSMFEGSLDSFT